MSTSRKVADEVVMIEKLDKKWRDLSSHYSQSQHANIPLQLIHHTTQKVVDSSSLDHWADCLGAGLTISQHSTLHSTLEWNRRDVEVQALQMQGPWAIGI
jgi:hypothetical protein